MQVPKTSEIGGVRRCVHVAVLYIASVRKKIVGKFPKPSNAAEFLFRLIGELANTLRTLWFGVV